MFLGQKSFLSYPCPDPRNTKALLEDCEPLFYTLLGLRYLTESVRITLFLAARVQFSTATLAHVPMSAADHILDRTVFDQAPPGTI